jgi:hypothetical protein
MRRRGAPIIYALLAAALTLLPLRLHAAQAKKIRLAFSALAYANPPFWIAHDLKLFEKYGLESEIVYVGGSRPIQAMLGGSIDVSQVGGAAAVAAAAQGAEIAMLGTVFSRLTFAIHAGPQIKQISDLKGKTLAAGAIGGNSYFAALAFLKHFGWVANRDIGVITAGGSPEVLAGMQQGRFQAGVLTPPTSTSIYKGEIAKAGGQVYWMHMAVTRGGNYPAIKDNVLRTGDIFRVDMGCSVNGYHADVCKSGCIGAEPTAEHRKRYDAIQAGVLKSVEALKPGIRPQELYETMIAGVRANGLPNYSNFFLGHTIGLEAREFPFLIGPAEEVDDPFLPNTTNVPMEPGMTVNLEASNHEAGWGTVQVEYTCAVTETGHEHLVTPDQRLMALPLQ